MPDINYIEKVYSLEENSVKDLEKIPHGIFIHLEFKRKSHVCPVCNSTLETMLIKSKDLTKAYWLKETFKRLFKTDILNITMNILVGYPNI